MEETKEKKRKMLRLTCIDDSDSYEPGDYTLAEFHDDAEGQILHRPAKWKAIAYIHNLLYAVTNGRFHLLSELNSVARDVSVEMCGVNQKGEVSAYNVPLSIIQLFLDKYDLTLEEEDE